MQIGDLEDDTETETEHANEDAADPNETTGNCTLLNFSLSQVL